MHLILILALVWPPECDPHVSAWRLTIGKKLRLLNDPVAAIALIKSSVDMKLSIIQLTRL